MKLNSDCIRAILLMVEDKSGFNRFVEYKKDKCSDEHISKYSHDEIMYHIKQCDQADLITGVKFLSKDYAVITDLTPKGHEFIANIRKDTIWNKIKSIGIKIGITSLPGLINIASNVINEIIKAEFDINGKNIIT